MRKLFVSVFVCLLLLVGFRAVAQSINAGDIRGTVTDPTGAVIPGATVTVLNVDTGVSHEFTTNSAGVYDTNSIVPGHYTVTFSHTGFAELVRGPVTLEVGFTTVNAQLKVGSTQQQVTVTTDVPLLSTESGEQSTTLDARAMDELPQVTQDWENFVILLPGATGCTGSSCSQGSANPGQVASVNGNLPYNNILADGASNTLSHSQNAQPATFENVAELQVNTSSFSAQYGIGGIIFNQISKGGSNTWHGSAYDYVQNNIFRANDYNFNSGVSTVGTFHYNDFGGTVSGPAIRNKMFFYFNYDQIKDTSPGGGTQSVPTTGIIGGNFVGMSPLYDPTTQVMTLDSNNNLYPLRQSFASEYGSNIIPTTMFDTVAGAEQAFWPTPSSHIPGKFVTGAIGGHGEPINNFVSQVPSSNPWHKYFGRLDYDITPHNRLSMSDSQQDNPAIYASGAFACPINCQAGDVDNNNAQITDVWQITPHVTNEVRLGYTWQGNFFADLALGKGYASKLGWQYGKADDFPAINFTDGDWSYAWIDPSSNAVYKEHVFDPSDVVTVVTGKHILHFGAEVLMYQDNSTAWGNTNAGSFDFGSPGWGFNQNYTAQWQDNGSGAGIVNSTGWAYGDFLLGLAHSWSASVTPEYGGRLKSPQLFVQDDYKITPNLTINAGVRWQATYGWSEVHNNIDSFDPTVMNPATGTAGAYWFASTGANGRHQLQANTYSTFMPRIGFSWLHDPKTTVRGGFGLYAYNMSLDTYGGGMGGTFGASGGAAEYSGISPIVTLSGAGNQIAANNTVGATGIGTVTSNPLPFTPASTDPTRYNGQSASGQPFYTPIAKIWQWNLGVQREINTNLEAELTYVGSHGMHLSFPMNLNQIPVALVQQSGVNTSAIPYYAAYGTNGIGWNLYNAISNYHSLQAQLNKRMSHGLNFSFNYVLSKFLDEQDSSGWGSRGGPQNYQNGYYPRSNYGPSNFDVRQAFKGYAVYQLPFGKGKPFLNKNLLVDEIAGGWEISGTVVLTTGHPFQVFGDQNLYDNNGSGFPNLSGASLHVPHQTARCAVQQVGVSCSNSWYNAGAFMKAANGTFGNVGRNTVYGPGINVFNMSAHKEFKLYEGWGHTFIFQFRTDAQNVFNHASFGPPSGALTGAGSAGDPYTGTTAGEQPINSVTVGGRNLQVSGHITF